ncbi:DUF2529 family protein [Thalassobacillus sp. CUG 92003]|uniref:DUF2529 family protein n=1 Tax=Thalassobacillus sp. CUG 92003 TaxID=2736641 RepID=UPI0015E67B75|nr:DUF2529 family protein [Thalassobacillus sp. CUG 92003]
MHKMLTTQLTGQFQQIAEQEDLAIEEGARALAQALAGEGHIYVKGFGEMIALEAEINHGAEALPRTYVYTDDVSLTDIDRVLIASRFADHEEALDLTKHAQEKGVAVTSLSAVTKGDNPLQSQADFHIDTKLTEPLLPMDTGRIGFPSVMTMFYTFFVLKLTIQEMMEDYE